MKRRDFCKKGLLLAGGLALPLTALELFNPARLLAEKSAPGDSRWIFLVDTHKCVGCGLCVKDCPMDVYELQNEVSVPVRPANCMGCLSCHEICPAQALEHQGIYPARRHYVSIRVCEMLRKVI